VNISGVHQEAVSFQDGLETLIMLKLLRQKCTCKTWFQKTLKSL
jgi:hypothetical protein